MILILVVALASCGGRAYETDGHNSVQLPDGFEAEKSAGLDSLLIEPEH